MKEFSETKEFLALVAAVLKETCNLGPQMLKGFS